jgi:long-chain acyl-CoA synthetase
VKHHAHYAKTKPKSPAVILAESGKTILWEEYNRRVNQLAQYFRDIGLKEKDTIAILMENSGHYLEILDAAVDAGLLFTTISTHLKQIEISNVRLGFCM